MHKAGPVCATSELTRISLSLTFPHPVRSPLSKHLCGAMNLQHSEAS